MRWSRMRAAPSCRRSARRRLQLLDPQPGELILDVGCGDGALTAKIAEAGADVIGVDASGEMIDAARARGIDAFVADAEALGWTAGRAVRAVRRGLLQRRPALDARSRSGRDRHFRHAQAGRPLRRRDGRRGQYRDPARRHRGGADRSAAIRCRPTIRNGIPTVDEFARIYAAAGFTGIEARLIERPTDLPDGIAGWVRTFRSGLLDVAMVPKRSATRSPRPSSSASPAAAQARRQLFRGLCPASLFDAQAGS